MGQIRDAARTRQRLVDAAVEEFSEKGFEGARVESIARRAGVSKQLVAHYFAGKEALFKEVLAINMRAKDAETVGEQDPGRLLRQRFELAQQERTWLSFVLWEAAEFAGSARIAEESARTASIARQRDSLTALRTAGHLDARLDVEMLQLALLALSTYPITFAQVTRMVTGLDPDSPEFRARWNGLLARFDAALAPAPAKSGKPPVTSGRGAKAKAA